MTPQEALDRMAARVNGWHNYTYKADIISDVCAILAEVQPEQGVTLTDGMAGCAMAWLDIARVGGYVPDEADRIVMRRLRGDV